MVDYEKKNVSNVEEKVEEPKVEGKKNKKKRAKRTPEQKRRSGAIAIVTCLCLLVALAIILSSFSAASQVSVKTLMNRHFDKVVYGLDSNDMEKQLTPDLDANGYPVKDADGFYSFDVPEGRDFKVLQLTDVHIGGGFASKDTDVWAMNAVATMVTQERPDLVIITGDIAYPVPFQAGTFNNLNATKIFSEMMTKLGVYWTFTYGNHDTETYGTHTREDINAYYKSQQERGDDFGKYCLFNPIRKGVDSKGKTYSVDGFSNQLIKVKKSGKVQQVLICLDSHSYHDNDKLGILWHYDSIHDNQQKWFCEEMDKINKANNGGIMPTKEEDIVPASLFIHIPLEEYREAFYIVEDKDLGDKDIIDRHVKEKNPTAKYISGVIGEKAPYSYSGTYGCTTFERCSQHGLRAVFCGHDHYNNIIMEYSKLVQRDGGEKGDLIQSPTVKLVYGRSVDYLAYPGIWKNKFHRGCDVITLKGHEINPCNKDYYKDYDPSKLGFKPDKAKNESNDQEINPGK